MRILALYKTENLTMEKRYNVYFSGQLVNGHEYASVRGKLAKVFNANEQTLDKLFSGTAQLIKRECDETTALQYKAAMEGAGALPILKVVEAVAATPKTMTSAEKIAALAATPLKDNHPSSQPAAAIASETNEESADAHSTGLNLAPTGSDVLRQEERAREVVREVDTSALELDAHASRLSPQPSLAADPPDTSHLDIDEVGATIPNLPNSEAPLSPNIEGISLSPDGTDLSDCSRPQTEEQALDLSGLELAPSGSDVLEEQFRNQGTDEAPATDHLSLDN
jgi:hypothetical protein